MKKVPVRPLKRPIKGVPVGEVVHLDANAAHVFVSIGRAERVIEEPKPVFVQVLEAVVEEVKPKRKRNYKRRDMRAGA